MHRVDAHPKLNELLHSYVVISLIFIILSQKY